MRIFVFWGLDWGATTEEKYLAALTQSLRKQDTSKPAEDLS